MRLYVKISDEMGERLEKYAAQYGMSKSSFVAYSVGKHINELDYQANTYKSINDKLTNIMDEKSKKGELAYESFQNNG